jgi:hypothetical protein
MGTHDDLLTRLLADTGQTIESLQMKRGGSLPTLMRGRGIEPSEDLERIKALPRRALVDDELIQLLSETMRIRSHNDKGEENLLRPGQVAALRECYEQGGLFGPMPCGSGKTLVTFLLPTLLQAERPVLLAPAQLIRPSKTGEPSKTHREFLEYRENWRVRLPKLISYTEVSNHEDLLQRLSPDLLMLDEAHKARNLDAGCTRRIRRYVDDAAVCYVPLSGTLMTDRLMDYHHLAGDALGEGSPMPKRPADAERWARALDKDVGLGQRIALGALETIEGGFHMWMRESAGVVHVPGSDCDASLEIGRWKPKIPGKLQTVIDNVSISGLRPDGELLNEWELPTCLSQLACGLYLIWDPLPPSWWLDPRRNWWAYSRAVLDEHLLGFDTEGQLVRALDGTGTPPYAVEGRAFLKAWRAVKDKFEPNSVPVWITDSICRQALDHIDPEGWLVWTRYQAPGEKLAELGLPYCGGGVNPEPLAGRSCAVSIAAHSTGRNLQAWRNSLVLAPPGKNEGHEQLVSRTHREGQAADRVLIEYIDAIPYHADVLERVKTQARATFKASGLPQKLVDATWI